MTARSLTREPERWLSGGLLVLMPAAAAMFWALERNALAPLPAAVLLAVMIALPISAGFLAPVALPALGVRQAVTTGLYALAAIVSCGSFAMWFEVQAYVVAPPFSVMLAACLVSLVVYLALSGWAFRNSERVVWGWGAAFGAGIMSWLAMLLLILLLSKLPALS